VDIIDQSGNAATQVITPEILWRPETGGYVYARPVVYNNVIYTGTNIWIQGVEGKPVELAGFDTGTKEMVFHVTFGGPEDIGVNALNIERGIKRNPIFIHDGVLYYLSTSIGAWDLTTGEKLYRHVFAADLPEPKMYLGETLQAVFYKGNVYYTNLSCYEPDSTRNIHCINAATGKLVWNAIAKNSSSMDTNPIIAHDKLYVPQYHGLWVYNPRNGKLIGVDRLFLGESFGRNILYKDYMICIQNDKNDNGRLVAVDVSK
jgi:outer membrane protein assembly factor BamB